MDLVVSGKTNKNIAAELGLCEKTVEVHRARVMAKMEADSLAHPCAWWQSSGPRSSETGRQRSIRERVSMRTALQLRDAVG